MVPLTLRDQATDNRPDLEIVIVAYRSLPVLRRGLESLRANVLLSVRTLVHVLDNASGDGHREPPEPRSSSGPPSPQAKLTPLDPALHRDPASYA